jgi:hypothetical protein
MPQAVGARKGLWRPRRGIPLKISAVFPGAAKKHEKNGQLSVDIRGPAV